MLRNIYVKVEKNKTKKIFSTLKCGVNSFINMLGSNENDLFIDLMPHVSILKILFEAFESKIFPLANESESTKVNEIIYLSKMNYENFKLISENEKIKLTTKYLMRIRILSNQLLKLNFDFQNLLQNEPRTMREINFFGLLLKVSKEFLTPNYNLIIHIPGGGFFSQSSESHLSYLSNWCKEMDCVIISFDYKLSSNNKYPVLLDECIKAYEIITKFSAKLFSKRHFYFRF